MYTQMCVHSYIRFANVYTYDETNLE